MAYRFIHTADIHLDSPLRSLALRNPELAELIGNATRHAFVSIIDMALAEAVDALLIAGDLYDGEQTSMKTARFLADQLRRLDEAGIAVFIIRGNHDALSKITKELVLPDSVRLFSGRAEAIDTGRQAGGKPVVIHGLSFAQPQAPDSLLPRYKPPVEGAINIGMMHTSLGGALGHDVYAPCSLADLQASGFRYWALGHIHQRAVYEGQATVVMPGIPQGRDINEAGRKSASLVTIDDNGIIKVEERTTGIARFERVAVTIRPDADWKALALAMTDALDALRQHDDDSHLVVRLGLEGTTPLAWRIRRDLDLLAEEAASRAGLMDRISIEKLENHCSALETKSVDGQDPVDELARLMDADILASVGFRDEARSLIDDFARSLPPDLRGLFGQDEETSNRIAETLAKEGSLDVLAHLKAGSGREQA